MPYLQVSTMLEGDLRAQWLAIEDELQADIDECKDQTFPNTAQCDYIGDDLRQEMIAINQELIGRGLLSMMEWLERNENSDER